MEHGCGQVGSTNPHHQTAIEAHRHQTTRRIVLDQRCARRSSILKPTMIASVNLDQLAEARARLRTSGVGGKQTAQRRRRRTASVMWPSQERNGPPFSSVSALTTHVSRRTERDRLFITILAALYDAMHIGRRTVEGELTGRINGSMIYRMSTRSLSANQLAALSALIATPATKAKASITLSGNLLKVVDSLAGAAQRSAWIERAVQSYAARQLKERRREREAGAIK